MSGPNSSRMCSLVRGYYQVDLEVVWNVIEQCPVGQSSGMRLEELLRKRLAILLRTIKLVVICHNS